ncbi:MAG: NUDIX hydrolase [Xanthomonadales bacterium]|nr:NUDIX hydrolase [Xanthomonadales bacterium]
MKLATGVFDVWTFRRDSDATRYLLLYTSQTKADRHFNGGRFWQIPSNFVRQDEPIENAIIRRLGELGLTAAAIWAGEHAYIIYNRRFREMQVIGVYAAEVSSTGIHLEPEEHSDYGWYTMEECLDRVHYRGLKEGLQSVHDFVTGIPEPAEELCLYRIPE